MEIVIDIPDQIYNQLIETGKYLPYQFNTKKAIKEGTPLPKWHGDLIDRDELKKEYPHDEDWEYPVNTNSYVVESIDNAPTIIQANKESEDTDADSN